MSFLGEIVLELIFGIFTGEFKNESKTINGLDIKKIVETTNNDSYIAGLIATSIAISYDDDHKLDKEEEKIINQLIKNNPYELTKKSRKNLNYIRKQKISIENLNVIYVKLNIDNYLLIKITNDLEYIIKHSEKDPSIKIELLNKIRENFKD